MSILPFGFQSDRDPNKCAGQRIEGDWFPLQTPYSRRAFYLNKTMQLSKPAHGLRETCLHIVSSCKRFLTFSGTKSENYLEKMCYKKKKQQLVKRFFEAYVFKKQKTVCALTVLWNLIGSCLHMGHISLPYLYFPALQSTGRWCTFDSEINFYFSHFLFYQGVVQLELHHHPLNTHNTKELLAMLQS